jgi:hypothetical protein
MWLAADVRHPNLLIKFWTCLVTGSFLLVRRFANHMYLVSQAAVFLLT